MLTKCKPSPRPPTTPCGDHYSLITRTRNGPRGEPLGARARGGADRGADQAAVRSNMGPIR